MSEREWLNGEQMLFAALSALVHMVVYHLVDLPASIPLWLLIILVALGLQGVGHLVFERSFPAFTLVEAVLLTPFFLVLSLFFWSGT